MSDDHDTVETITRQIDTDKLLHPDHDVRRERRDADVSRIAQSLERSGQIHAVRVWPVRPVDHCHADEWAAMDVQARYEAATEYKIDDGVTRVLAAGENNWATVRCEVFPDEPDEQTIVSLEANVSRVDMDEFETIEALREWAEREGLTSEEVGDQIGYSDSYIRNLFRLMDEPDQVTDAWASPETHITASHVGALAQLPSIAEKERLMRYVLEHELSVSRTRDRVKSRLQTLEREAQQGAQRSADHKGGLSDHDQQASAEEPEEDAGVACVLTGDQAYADITIPVSESMYGTLQRLMQTDESLLALMGEDTDTETEASDEATAEAW